MKDANYVTVQGWMVNRLKLSGNELMVYAIIYGFSQDKKSKFKGSAQYVADTFGITRRAVIIILNRLAKKNYIKKFEYRENGVKYCDYQVTDEYLPKKGAEEAAGGGSEKSSPPGEKSSQGVVKKVHRGSEKDSPGGSEKSSHHITKRDNIFINKETGGLEKPPDKKPKQDKPKKPPLREREPENDMEHVEKAYLQNWDTLYSQKRVRTPDPVVNWNQTRALLKRHFEKLKPGQIIQAINNGMENNWVMGKGYPLGVMLSAGMLNELINARQGSPPSSHQQQKKALF
jgi:hypothetical protein